MKRLPAIRLVPRKACSLLLVLLFLGQTNTYAQGWIDITPASLESVYSAQAFDFADSSFQVYVVGAASDQARGHRLSEGIWDSILVHRSWNCGVYGDRANQYLLSIGKSYTDPNLGFSIFSRTGCITECYFHVFRDTTGLISMEDERFFLDDFTCNGFYSTIVVSPFDDYYVFLALSDSLYYSSDRGITFMSRSAPIPADFSTHDYLAPSPDDLGLIFAGGYEAPEEYQILKSIDTAETWMPVLEEPISPVEFVENDPTRLYAASASGVLRSTDLGDTWFNVFPSDSRFVETRKTNPSEVFAGTASGNLYRSSDAGQTWSIYNDTFSDFPVLSIYSMPGSDTLIVTTTTGVFKVFDSFVLDAGEGLDVTVAHFSLHQNYPNPFNPITSIGFEMKEPGLARVSVFDILGREITILVHEELPRGSHARTWDGANFPSGIYYYRLTTETFSHTKQMVLIK